jgi:AAHS family 3-hydroxyphenylpropionic acid transporter
VIEPALNGSMVRRTILFCFLASLCEGFDIQAAGVAASGIAAEFTPTSRLLGFIFSASTLGLLAGALIGGGVADVMGRKAVLIASILSFAVASLLTAAAPGMACLAYARFATGLGLGGALPSILALAAEADANQSRRSHIALLYSGAPVGAALASLTSLLVTAAHWRWIFTVGGIMPLALAPLIAGFMSESVPFRMLRSARRARSAEEPVQLRAPLSRVLEVWSGRTLLLWVGFCVALLTLYLLLNWLPTLLVARGLARSQAAAAQIGFNLGGTVAILWISRMLDTRSRRVIVIATFAAVPCLLALLALLAAQAAVVIAVTVLLGGAVLASQAILYALAPRCYPTPIRGVGLGVAVAAGRIGAIAGPVMVGLILAAGQAAGTVFLILVPLVVTAGLAAVWLDALTADEATAQSAQTAQSSPIAAPADGAVRDESCA